MAAVSLYQDSISQSLNAVIEARTPNLTMPVLNQATGATTPKKPRKRKPKIKQETDIKREPTDWSAFNASVASVAEGCDSPVKKIKQEKITDHLPKVKKKRDRFNGMPEEEVEKRLLPDHLKENLDIVIVGINPGLFAAYVGHHYAGPGNHFWKCLYLSGLVPEPMNAYEDHKLLDFGIGFTNICARTTRGSADLKRLEIKEGGHILKEKLQQYKPKIAAFNGKGIYEIFCGHKKFSIGKQPEPLEGTDTVVYVMPSSSARCAQLPRAVDKVPFYEALKKLRDYINAGKLKELDDAEVTFPTLELKIKKEEPVDDGYIKAEQGADGSAPQKKPKKKRNRKSAEATVTSSDLNVPFSGEVSYPFSMPNSIPQIKQEPGHFNPQIKQEPMFGKDQYGGFSNCATTSGHSVPHVKQEPIDHYGGASRFGYPASNVTMPGAMPPQFMPGQMYPYPQSSMQYPFPMQSPFMSHPPAYNQSNMTPSTTLNHTTMFNSSTTSSPQSQSAALSPTTSGQPTTLTPMSSGQSTTLTPMSSSQSTTLTPMSSSQSTTLTPMSSSQSTTLTPMSSSQSTTLTPMSSGQTTTLTPMSSSTPTSPLNPSSSPTQGSTCNPTSSSGLSPSSASPLNSSHSAQNSPLNSSTTSTHASPLNLSTTIAHTSPFNPASTLTPIAPLNLSTTLSTTSVNSTTSNQCTTNSPPSSSVSPKSIVNPPVTMNPAMTMNSAMNFNPAMTMNSAMNFNPAMTMNSAMAMNSAMPMNPAVTMNPAMSFNPAVTMNPAMTFNPAMTMNPAMAFNPAMAMNPAMTFNPAMSHMSNYTQMAHMANNGFHPQMSYPPSQWNRFPHNQYYPNMMNSAPTTTTSSREISPKSSNENKGSNQSSVPFIKAEPEDSGYELTTL